ncbi:MAG: pyrroline-5-carboxylate reductase [Stappiaceae bacterium]
MNLSPEHPLLLVGAGKMGGAMLQGWLDHGHDPNAIVVSDPNPSDDMVGLFKNRGVRLVEKAELAPTPAVALIAVKPQIMRLVLDSVASTVSRETLVLSIAAGTPIAAFEEAFGDVPVVRAMPNTPAQVKRGITAAVGNSHVQDDHVAVVTELLSAIGTVIWVEREDQIDLVTAVSGSGPAYVFLLAECLAEAGRRAGLPADVAIKLARHTVSGAGELMHQSDLSADVLRKNVTSPGGTTAAALDVLMAEGGLQKLMDEAILSAARRAAELAD